MLRTYMIGKIHRATVTEANRDYVGSLSVDAELLAAAGIQPYEMVQITNVERGSFWRTYVIPAPAGEGTICLNGSAARWFSPGDHVIVIASAQLDPEEAAHLSPVVVFVDDDNRIVRVARTETNLAGSR